MQTQMHAKNGQSPNLLFYLGTDEEVYQLFRFGENLDRLEWTHPFLMLQPAVAFFPGIK